MLLGREVFSARFIQTIQAAFPYMNFWRYLAYISRLMCYETGGPYFRLCGRDARVSAGGLDRGLSPYTLSRRMAVRGSVLTLRVWGSLALFLGYELSSVGLPISIPLPFTAI